MNKLIAGMLVASVMASTAAIAALNPASPGLPSANGLEAATANNQGSAMCIDCHTTNPFTPRQAATGVFPRYSWQTALADFMGTHYVGLSTNTGGGITLASASLTPRNGHQYFNLAEWTGNTGGYSKYYDQGTNLSYVVSNTAIRNAQQDTTLGNYDTREMICESCHSVVKNVAGGRNLLGGGVADANGKRATADTGLCEGCHVYMLRSTTAPNRGNNSPDANNHHVLSAAGANRIEDALAAARLLWTRANVATGPDRDMSTAPTYTGEGQEIAYRVQSTFDGGVAPRRADFNCTDCHAYGHGGRTDTAARLFRTGESSGTDNAPINPGAQSEVGVNTGAGALGGIARLEDLLGASKAVGATVWSDEQGFCEGCHYYAK